jgi:hypothetical protein
MPHQIIGYGEDALTYWALTTKLQDILDKLDKTKADDCLVFYRPSFGRGMNIGEFDAILATPKTVYLIESKWQGPKKPKTPPKKIVLGESQPNRHSTLKEIRQHWLKDGESIFAKSDAPILVNERPLPAQDTILARNVGQIFGQIDTAHPKAKTMKDVCLYFSCEDDHTTCPKKITVVEDKQERDVSDFQIVQLHYPLTNNARGFISLDSPLDARIPICGGLQRAER